MFGKKRWEYMVVRDKTNNEFSVFDKKGLYFHSVKSMGLEGWELVSVINTTEHSDYDREFHFKRPM